jgi:hypothetical protein
LSGKRTVSWTLPDGLRPGFFRSNGLINTIGAVDNAKR